MLHSALRVGSLLVLLAGVAMGQQPAIEQLPPDSLLTRSFSTPSATEKAYLRAMLARRHADTPAGRVAAVWLFDRAGGIDTAVQRRYRAVLDRSPDDALALNNLAANLAGAERLALMARLEAAQPAAFDWAAVRDQYATLRGDLKDTARAAALLREREGRIPAWVQPFLVAFDAQELGNAAAAESLFARAAGVAGAPWLAQEQWLRTAFVAKRDTAGLGRAVREYAGRAHAMDRHRALMYLGERLGSDFADGARAAEAFLAAYAAVPTSEAAIAAAEHLARVDRDSARAVLARAAADLPWNWTIRSWAAAMLLDQGGDTARVRAGYLAAMQLAPTPYDSMLVADRFGRFLQEHALDFDGARRLYERLRPRLVRASDALELLYDNSIAAGEYTRALRELVEVERALVAEGGRPSATWFADRHAALARYLANEEQRARFLAERPLMIAWEAQFGRSLSAEVAFASGSAAVPAAAAQTFAAIARLLQEPGADQYVFSITGSAAAGEPNGDALALARARAVADTLFSRHGVARARLQVDVAPARARTAGRVTIVPVGSAGAPRVAATASLLPSANVSASVDGRHVAIGSEPAQLWDLEAGTRLRDLGTAGDVAFSPDGRYVAATSNFGEAGGAHTWSVFVYDAKLGIPAAQLAGQAAFTHMAWDPEGRRLALTTFTNRLIIYDVEQRRIVRTAHARNAPVLWMRDGRRIVVVRDSGLAVLDAATLAPVDSVTRVQLPRRMVQTGDGRSIVVLTNDGQLLALDAATLARRELRPADRDADGWMAQAVLAAAPTGSRVVYGVPEERGHRVAVVDVAAPAATSTAQRVLPTEFTWTADGSGLLEASRDSLWRVDAATLERLQAVRGTAPRARGGAADVRRGYFLSVDDGGVHVWNVATGRKVHVWPEVRNLHAALPGDSVFVASRVRHVDGDSATELTLLRTSDFTAVPFARTALRADFIATARGLVAIAGAPWRDSTADSITIELYDAAGARLRSLRVPTVTSVSQPEIFRSDVRALALSPDGRRGAIATEWIVRGGFDVPSEIAMVFDVATGRIEQAVDFEESIWSLAFADSVPGELRLSGNALTWRYDLAAREFTGEAIPRIANEARVAAGRLQWSANGVELHRADGTVERAGFPYHFPAIAHFPDRNLIVMLNEHNELTFRDVATLETRLTVISKLANQWLAYSPSGQFTASLAGTEKVFWALGDRLLPFDALKARFDQPAVLTRQLAAAASGTGTRGPAPAIRAETYGEPFTVVASEREVHTAADRFVVEVALTPREPGMAPPALHFRQQGLELPADDSTGRVQVVPQPNGHFVVRRPVLLAQGLNVLDVDYEVAGAVHRGATIRVRREAAAEAGALPRLFFLGIGTSRYEKPQYNLRFARKDVEDVAAELTAQRGDLYSEVHTRLLVDSTATQQNIKREIREFLGQAASNDVLVIYLAGHGAKDQDETLYYMPHEGDLSAPYTGMEIAFFRNFLRSRPPSQKAIFFMDICHAGALGEGVRGIGAQNGLAADDAVKLLAQGTGTVILASSTGRESSLEDERFGSGNGAFTAAVLELLQGRADPAQEVTLLEAGDTTRIGRNVTVGQLQLYVSRRVPVLTNGRQHPTSPLVENLRDYPVARAGARRRATASEGTGQQ